MKFLFVIVTTVACVSCNLTTSKTDQKKSDLFNYRAKFFLETRQYDSAESALREALYWDPKNWAAYNNRAILKIKKNLPEKDVIEDFNVALSLKPNYENSLYSLANYYIEIKKYDKALQACNNYIDFSRENDFDSVEAINHLKQKCEDYLSQLNRNVNGILISKALSFYDSVNSIIDEAHPTEQRFIDMLGKSMLEVLDKKEQASIDINSLRRSLDSAKKINELKLEKISAITEIDSELQYKQVVLKYSSLFDNAYKKTFKFYIDDLSSKNIPLIIEASNNLKPELREIKIQEGKFKQAQIDFRNKYSL